MALFNYTPLHLPSGPMTLQLTKFFRQIITSVPRTATYEVELNVANVPANSTSQQNFTVVGLELDDIVYVNQPTNLATIYVLSAWVSAKDQVTMLFWNNSGGAVDPPATGIKFKLVSIRR